LRLKKVEKIKTVNIAHLPRGGEISNRKDTETQRNMKPIIYISKPNVKCKIAL